MFLFFGPNVNDDTFIEVPFSVNLHKIVQMLSVRNYFSVFDRLPITFIVCSVSTPENEFMDDRRTLESGKHTIKVIQRLYKY